MNKYKEATLKPKWYSISDNSERMPEVYRKPQGNTYNLGWIVAGKYPQLVFDPQLVSGPQLVLVDIVNQTFLEVA